MAKLCEVCKAFKDWNLPDKERWGRAKFAHYPTGAALHQSALQNCHLCILIERALLNSTRPTEDVDLPSRQIWLECLEASLRRGETRIRITIEPLNLASAGCRQYSPPLDDVVEIYTKDPNNPAIARQMHCKDQNAELRPFYIIHHNNEQSYYYGSREIESDMFFALVNPYYQACLELAPIPETISNVLDQCSKLEDQSTGSASTLHLISSWLDDCLKNHQACERYAEQIPFLPTRVIDVTSSNDHNCVRLHIAKPSERGRYFALSHRWGNTKPLTTTTETLQARTGSIRMSEISQTFRDAIYLTRQFGIQYLWIDSLCIIQDSVGDWRSESAKMGKIYRLAMLTIAAVDADDATTGCFVQRNGLRSRPCRLDIKSHTFPQSGITHACPPLETGNEDLVRRRGLLDSRTWVLQEQILSPRTLNFNKDQVFWECLTKECSEPTPEGVETPYNHDTDYVQILKRGIGGLVDLGLEGELSKLHKAWLLMVQNYSRRKLTKKSDKMRALLGVADELALATGDTFIAGLWQKHLCVDLLWCVYGPECPTIGEMTGYSGHRGPAGQRLTAISAPSWSWLQIEGHIRYIESYRETGSQHELLARIDANSLHDQRPEAGPSAHDPARTEMKIRGTIKPAFPLSWRNAEVSGIKMASQGQTASDQAETGFRHLAICDNCNQEIVGIRHKCLDCHDFDYCSVCIGDKDTTHNPNHHFTALTGATNQEARSMSNSSTIQHEHGTSASSPSIETVDQAKSSAEAAHDDRATRSWRLASDLLKTIWDDQDSDSDEETAPKVYTSSFAITRMLREVASGIGINHVHSDYLEDLETDNVQPAERQYLLFSLQLQPVGYWAPDVTGEVPVYAVEEVMSVEERSSPLEIISLDFLAISRSKGYVWCLGLSPVIGREGEYYRLGLGWILEKEWAAMAGMEREVTLV